MDAAAGVDAHDAPTPACKTARRAVSHKRPQPVSFLLITPLKNPEAVPTLRHASRLLHFRVTVNTEHPLTPLAVLTARCEMTHPVSNVVGATAQPVGPQGGLPFQPPHNESRLGHSYSSASSCRRCRNRREAIAAGDVKRDTSSAQGPQ